ncbi:40S small subunit processome assembly factor 1 isoform X2 [Phascolarctos cinereus]|uniref:Uncharacterized protein C1orf131 homolog isoform X2 n=1 Tax=Phascolarctos cinereus TaxID=38626 RepID=A0A6P5LHF2_PHACI|nr:uncharacterized protein C1orf131 homolog isoform X2 [Phascolarctos cinereus]
MAKEKKPRPDDSCSPESLLDTLLHNLYDFGETLDKKTLKRSKNKKNKRDSVTAEVTTADTALQPESLSRGQKKSASNFFRKLKEELLCDSLESSTGPTQTEVSTTISPVPLLTKGKREPVEVVEFHSWNKKKKTELEPPKDEDTKEPHHPAAAQQPWYLPLTRNLCLCSWEQKGRAPPRTSMKESTRASHLASSLPVWLPSSEFLVLPSLQTKISALEKDVGMQEFNLEKARLEVHRFGITGYGKRKERILEQERAIMLGAKPPKNNYVNYKVLQEQIKEKKAAKEEEKRMAQVTDTLRKKEKKKFRG